MLNNLITDSFCRNKNEMQYLSSISGWLCHMLFNATKCVFNEKDPFDTGLQV